MKIINKIKRKTVGSRKNALRLEYIDYYRNLPLEKAVFVEARNGKEIDGNNYYVLKELLSNPQYSGYRIYVSTEDGVAGKIRKKIDKMGLADAEYFIVTVDSSEYYKAIATSEYIVCDATLKNFFMKREGQVYLNVWHGTPFKVMGRKVAHEPHATGNAQKNFVAADYLLYPNEYMMDHMVEDYMISDISPAKAVLGGYPRNSAFFDNAKRDEIRRSQNLEGKRIYVYMPTHRPELMGSALNNILDEMDALLNSGEKDTEEILFAKIHPLAADDVDFSRFRNIRAFPAEYETYEFLNVADCLITDYSSVFYDFAVTGRKIVLYTYDEEEYLSTRGLYSPMSSLPFVQVKTVADTINQARTPKEYDDSAFIAEYCSYDSADATKNLCSLVFGSDNSASSQLKLSPVASNGLPNIMVYAGKLSTPDEIEAATEYLAKADTNEANYYLVFNRGDVKDNFSFLLNLPEDIRYFGRAGKMAPPINGKSYSSEDFRLEWLRCFDRMPVSEIVMLKEDDSQLCSLLKWKH